MLGGWARARRCSAAWGGPCCHPAPHREERRRPSSSCRARKRPRAGDDASLEMLVRTAAAAAQRAGQAARPVSPRLSPGQTRPCLEVKPALVARELTSGKVTCHVHPSGTYTGQGASGDTAWEHVVYVHLDISRKGSYVPVLRLESRSHLKSRPPPSS